MARPKKKPAAAPTPDVKVFRLNAFVDAVASRVAEKIAPKGQAPPSEPYPGSQAVYHDTVAPRPTPATTAEVTKVNHECASMLLSRLVALNERLRNIPPSQAAQGGQPNTAGPGLNDFLAEEGAMLADADETLSAISQYLGIEV